EKEKMSGEIQMDLDSPRSRASDLFIRTIFEDTCYSAVSSVIQENLDEMTSVYQAQKHYKQAYRPDRMIISMVGDQLPPERVTSLFEQYFPEENTSGAALGSTHDLLKNLKLQENKVVSFPRDDSNQAHIFKGWLAPEVKSADYPAMVVLNTILGGAGLSSRLFLELRDKQGLAYNVRSTYEAFQHKGLFYLYIGTEPSNKEKCLKGFITECDKLVQTAVSEKELGEAKDNIIGRRAIYLETAGQQANYVGANYALGRSLEEIDALPQRILEVTSQEVQAVAQKYLTLPSVISVVGPSSIL
ncbi:MAG: insulinase family protein, partial [Cyanobacteria bacterium]|nr:insulinase family protein [Cyanobacteriota bacterium]